MFHRAHQMVHTIIRHPKTKEIFLSSNSKNEFCLTLFPSTPLTFKLIFNSDAMAFVQASLNSSEDVADNNQTADEQTSSEIVFVDKSVEGYQEIVAEFVEGRDVEVFFINQGSAGLTQIADHLEGRSDLSAIHIISHGQDAELQLGNSTVGSADLGGQYNADLKRIGAALSESGDILIYGCELASSDAGEQFMEQLAEITNADVAASDDLTGSTESGGDWELERQTGAIEAQALSARGYEGVLLVTDAGFTVGTATFGGMNEIAVTPGGSRTYDNAATANSGAITIDLRMTLIDTFDENGNVTTGTTDQLPITFSDFAGGPVLLARNVGASVSGYEGHTAHIVIEFFDASTGGALSVVGDFTFKDIDYEIPTANGSGSEAVTVVSDQLQTLQISNSPTSSIESFDAGDGLTTFTNTTTKGGEADEERWIRATFFDMPQLNLRFTARNANTGYGLSTANFSSTPLSFSQPVATDDGFATDQNTPITGQNVITGNNGNGADSDPDGDDLTVSVVGSLSSNVGSPTAGTNGGLFTIGSDGTLDFDPDSDFDYLADGETATTTINYQITDGTGIADTATVTVIVTGTQDAPNNVGTIPNQNSNDDQTVSFDVSGYFNDADDSDTLQFDATTTLPLGLTIDQTTGVISGTIDNSASLLGPFTVVITATDDAGDSTSQSFTWGVTNPGPSATNNSAAVKEDTDLTDSGNVISDNDGSGTDSDPDNDAFSVGAVNGITGDVGATVDGSYGSVVINSNGTYTYTLDNNNSAVDALDNGESLSDSFTYTISDGEGGFSTATLTIAIAGTNDAPVVGSAIPSQSNDDADSIAGFDVSGYFSDSDDSSVFSGSGLPAGLSINAAGLISGTINNSASQNTPGGVFTVQITATDDNGANVSTTFSWTIANPGPTATDNTASVTENTSLTDSGNVISDNDGDGVDSDSDGDSIEVGAVESATGNVGVGTAGTYGSILIDANGDYTYSLNNNHPTVAALDNGDTLTETFSYTLSDGEGGTSDATITITIDGTNDAPTVAGSIPDQSSDDADSIPGLDVSGYFSDVDDTPTFSASGLPTGLSINSAGVISGTIDNSASQDIAGGVFAITITATDDNGASTTSTFEWTVANPGPNATDNSAGVTEDTSLTDSGNVITDNDGDGADSDVDNDSLNITAIDGTTANVGITVAGTYGSVVINSNGTYTYTLANSNANVEALDTGESVTDTFTYTLSDGEGGFSTATLTIDIDGTNDAPIVGSSIPSQANDDAQVISGLDISGHFSDVDDTPTFSATDLPTGLTISSSGIISGTIDNSASQDVPGGAYTVTIIATDDDGATVSSTFTWTVTNPGPTAIGDTFSTDEDTELTGTVATNDSDSDGDSLTYAQSSAPANGSVTLNSDGSFTYNPNADFHGTDSFQYQVTDADGAVATATVNITVDSVNDLPTVDSPISDQANLDADTISLNISGNFSDTESSGLTFSATGLPTGLTIDSAGNITGDIDSSASQTGTFTVVVTATDGNGGTITDTFTWDVTNPTPTAVDDTFDTDEDTPVSGSVSTNDGDADADSLTYAQTSNPASGTVDFNSDGTFTYTPVGDFNGQVTFNYQVTDADGATSIATVTINVDPVNDPPIVNTNITDQANLDSDSINIDIAGNFTDVDGDGLSFSAAGLPTGLSIDTDGNITGDIDSSASQTGSFTVVVTAADGNGGTVTDTFTWSVTNPGPTATNNTASVTEDASLTDSGNIIADDDSLGSDSDSDGDVLSISSIAGTSIPSGSTATIAGTYGSLSVGSDGSYRYTLDNANSAVQALGSAEALNESFIYTLADGEGGTANATLTITINGANDAPTVTSIPDLTNDDSDTVAIGVSTYFSDADTTDALTFSASGLPDGLSVNAAGLITGVIDNSASQTGPFTVTITAEDDFGATVSQTFEWTVNNPGPSASDDSGSTNQNATVAGNVLTNDSDVDGDNFGVVSYENNTDINLAGTTNNGTGGGLFTLNADGSYVFDPDGDFDNLADGETATTGIEYTITDGEGGTATATLTITITGTNDAPVVSGAIPDQSNSDVDVIGSLDVSSYFTDIDGTSLSFSAADLPAGLTINSSGVISGTIDNSASQGGVGGEYTVIVTATDDHGSTTSQSFRWGISNPGPSATNNSNGVTYNSQETATGNLITDDDGSGVDSDDDQSDLVVIEANGTNLVGSVLAGTYGDITINADGTYQYDLDSSNTDVIALTNTESLTESFTYRISDGEGGSSTATLALTITGGNDDPIVGGTIPNQTSDDFDAVAGVDVSTYFSDPDGDSLSFSASDLPDGLTIDETTGVISGQINNSASQAGTNGTNGVYEVTINADDGASSTSTTFTWSVANPGPTATDNTAAVTEDSSLTDNGNVITDNDGNGADNDSDDDDLSVSQVNNSATNVDVSVAGTYGSIQINSDGSYVYSVNNNHADVSALDNGETLSESFTYTVDDGEGGTSTATLTVTINGSNDTPVFGGTIPDQIHEDLESITSLNVSTYFSDPDGDTLTYSATSLPVGLAIDIDTGLITGTIDNSASQGGTDGEYSVTITAEDDNSETVSTTFNWTVTNPGPTATDNTGSVTEDGSLTDSGNVITDDDGNGVDSDQDNDNLTVTAVEGATGNVGVTLSSPYGSIVINSDGSYVYTVNNSSSDVQNLGQGQAVTDTYSYTLSDSEGGTSTATVAISINGTNDLPTVGSSIPDQANVDSDTGISLDVSSNFNDIDDYLTFTASGLPTGLSISSSGVITGDIDSSASQQVTDGEYSVTITAGDGLGSVSTTFTWSVGNPGPAATNNTAEVTEDTTLSDSGNVISDNDGDGVDSDPDGDDLSISEVNNVAANVGIGVDGSYGSIVFNSDGTYEYTLDNDNVDVAGLADGVTLTDNFTYTLSDSEGGNSQATLAVTIIGVNDAPISGGTIPDQSNVDSATISGVDISSLFSDSDGDTLTYSAADLPSGLTIDENTGVISGQIDSSASQAGTGGEYSVTVTAEDDDGATVGSTFTWTVTNPEPTANNDAFSTDEDTELTGTVATNDSDSDGDSLSYSRTSTPSNGTVTLNANGSFTYNPNADFHGADSFEYQVTDADGAVATATVNITVDSVNDLPIVDSPIADQANLDTDSISLSISGNFSDAEANGLTFSATGLPTGLSIDSAGNITGDIDSSASQTGTFTVVVTATDGNGGTITDTFTWSVTNPTPTAANDTFDTDEDTPVSGSVATNDGDSDGDDLTYAQTSNPASGTVDFDSDGTFTYTPVGDFNGQVTFDYQVTDADGATSTATVTINVDPVNDPPIVDTNIADQANQDGDSISVDISGNFTDIDGDGLNFSATELPTGLSIDTDGNITGSIDSSASQTGSFTVVVTATDGNGGSVTDTFTWSVTNPGPVANDDNFSTDEDTELSATVATNDSDPDGDSLSYSQLTNPAHGTVDFNSDGTFTYTPADDFFGTDSFDYTITDADGATSTATVNITINDVNDAPTVDNPIDDQANVDSETISLNVSGAFGEVDGAVTYSAADLPSGLTIDENTGVISGQTDSSASQAGTGGEYSVTVTAEDDDGATVSSTFTWTITNPGPDAVDDSVSTDEDINVDGDVSVNDSDPDGDSVAFSKITDPANGTVTFNADGTFSYDPNANFTGIDSFDYEIVDVDGASTIGTVTIVVGDVNDPPVVATPIENQDDFDGDTILLDLSSNFSDVELDDLEFSATGLPTGLTMSSSGVITGQIDNSASLTGTFSVVVTVSDGNGGSVSDSFTWNIANPAPDATDNSNSVDEDGTTNLANGNLLTDNDGDGIDSDPDLDELSVSAVDSQTTNVGVTVNGAYGTISIQANGSYTYTVDNSNPIVNGLDDGETLTETFGYTLSDGEGGTSDATISVTIAGSNDSPNTVATITDQGNLDDDAVSLDLSSHFADVDGDALTFSANGLPSGLTIDTSTGIVSGTIDNNASQLGSNDDGVFSVTITATDGDEIVDLTFEWTINNPVPISQDDSFTTNEDTAFSDTVATNDSDDDNDDVTFSLLNQPNNGSLTFNNDGTFNYTPAVDFHGTDLFNYQITDADGDLSAATVTITVNSINDAPTEATNLEDLSNLDSDVVSIDISSNFGDVDGDGISFAATGLPTGLTIDSTGKITGVIDSSASTDGPFLVTVTATDIHGSSVTATFEWAVTNPAPDAENDSFDTDEDTQLTGTVASNDADPDGDGLTFTIVNGPTNGSLTLNTNGSFTYDPSTEFHGNDSFEYMITDADGKTSTAIATIQINSINDMPEVDTPIADQSSLDNEVIGLDVSDTFGDVDGDDLTYSATGLPTGLSISDDGTITGTVDNNASSTGTFAVTITVVDGNGGTNNVTFDWMVTNPGPDAQNDSFNTDEDIAFLGAVTNNDSDPDNDDLTYSLLTGPSNGGVTFNSDGTFTYTPNANFFGTDTFEYNVTDEDGGTDTAIATINIVSINDGPGAGDDHETTDEDMPVTIDVLTNDSDPENDPLTVSISSIPVNGTVVVNPNGSITYTPNDDFFGSDSFEYELCDSGGLFTTATVTVDVASINDAPVADDDAYETNEETPLMGHVGDNDFDLEGDDLSFRLLTPPTDGSFTFNPDGSFVFVPNVDFNGPTSFEYEVCDEFGGCDTATVSIFVNAVNDAPTAVDDSESTTEDIAVTVNLLDNDSDVEIDDLIVIKIDGVSLSPGDSVTLASGATATLNSDGTVDYCPNGQFDDLLSGQSAIDTFTYTISDGNGGTAIAEAVITINGVNDVPIAEDDFVSTTVGTPVTISALSNDVDVENQVLSVILIGSPTEGTAVVNPDGTITYTPNSTFEGIVTLRYLVEDPDGGTSDATITIEVTPSFRFDAFTNFSESVFAGRVGNAPEQREQVLSQKIFSLAPEPIFSGYSRPGTQITGRIYDSSGALVGEANATTDPGGNWMMQFHSAKGQEFYRIEFEQVASGSVDVYGFMGLNPGDNSYQSMEPLTAYDKPLSIDSAMETSEMSLEQAHRHNQDSQGFGAREF